MNIDSMNIDLVKIFSSLANKTRLRCLYLVAVNNEACVCEIVAALNIPQPSASKALNALKIVGLLSVRKEANWNYFSLNQDMPDGVSALVASTIDGLASSAAHSADQERFKRLDLRDTQLVCRQES
ncbi:MAG: ArsR family transcriptional regulator [Halioglobus sp.]|jgi:ArsR family transcriptional regulator